MPNLTRQVTTPESRDRALRRLRRLTVGAAELLPELIPLDNWGYPIIASGPVTKQLSAHAKRAVASRPVLALALRRREATTDDLLRTSPSPFEQIPRKRRHHGWYEPERAASPGGG